MDMFETIKTKLSKLANLIKGGPANVWRRIKSNKLGVVSAVVAVLLLFGWRGLVWANKPVHSLDAARELGSIGEFKDDLFPNKAGTRIVYSQDTESGEGLFFCNVTTGKAKLLCELKESEFDWRPFGMLSWSPDDRRFAYVTHGMKDRASICVCDADSGDTITNIDVPGNFAELAWLTPDSFAYLLAYYQVLAVIQQEPDGAWVETRNFGRVYEDAGAARDLIATSAHSVAWTNGTNIWELDFNSGPPKVIWQATTNQLLDYTYSPEKNELLLNCRNEKGQFVIRLDPAGNWTAIAGSVSDSENPILNMAWLHDGVSYAYMINEQGTDTFFIKSNVSAAPTRLPWPGTWRHYALSTDDLFVEGSEEGEPIGIYDYDLKTHELRLVISGLANPLHFAEWVLPVDGSFTNSQGRVVSYRLWHPTHFLTEKKYPVVIAQTLDNGVVFPQVGANAGFYYLIVSRPGWFEGMDHWADDVMGAFNLLSRMPNVDTDRVILYACSIETSGLSQLLAEKPDPWKGIIMLCPGALPDLSNFRSTSVLVIDGKNEDKDFIERLKKYQNEAIDQGIRMKLVLEDGTGHTSRSIATERDRCVQIAKFLSEN